MPQTDAEKISDLTIERDRLQQLWEGALFELIEWITGRKRYTGTPLQRDGVPSFYINPKHPTVTHRLSEDDIPVWCRTADETMRVMAIVDAGILSPEASMKARLAALNDAAALIEEFQIADNGSTGKYLIKRPDGSIDGLFYATAIRGLKQ